MATARPTSSFVARYTWPMPPLPRSSSRRYFAARTCPARLSDPASTRSIITRHGFACAIMTVLGLAFLPGCPKKDDATDAWRGIEAGAKPSAEPSAAKAVHANVDVVSSASTVWEGGAPVVASGEVDGDAMRARTKARIAADTSPVTVLTGTKGPLDLGKRLCEAVVPQRPKETPILIKPNLGGFEWFKDPVKSGGDDGVHGRTTDVEFVRGIVKCLKARGH